jgi:hypothetical protein
MAVSIQKYITETKVFYSNSQTESNCNTVLFVNTGTSSVTIDGFTLTSGQSLSILGNRGELNVKTYTFTFDPNDPKTSLTVIYKRYIG